MLLSGTSLLRYLFLWITIFSGSLESSGSVKVSRNIQELAAGSTLPTPCRIGFHLPTPC